MTMDQLISGTKRLQLVFPNHVHLRWFIREYIVPMGYETRIDAHHSVLLITRAISPKTSYMNRYASTRPYKVSFLDEVLMYPGEEVMQSIGLITDLNVVEEFLYGFSDKQHQAFIRP